MTTATDALITQTNETALSKTAQEMVGVYDAILDGNLWPGEGNAEIFRVIANDAVAATVILAGTNQSGDLQTSGGIVTVPKDTAATIGRVNQVKYDAADRIALAVTEETVVETYLQQMANLNVQLLSRSPAVLNPERSLVDNFKAYQSIANPLKEALGFVDFAAERDRNAYWPNADSFQGNQNYIDLFRTSDTEKAKNLRFMAFFDGLSPTEQLMAYAWVYSASFESYLTIAAVPSDLPPWITSEALRTLHRTVNDIIMSDFEKEELEMLQ